MNLPIPQLPKRKVPLGKPLHRTPQQLDELSRVTQADIQKAQALWHNAAPKEFETLLDGQTLNAEQTPQ